MKTLLIFLNLSLFPLGTMAQQSCGTLLFSASTRFQVEFLLNEAGHSYRQKDYKEMESFLNRVLELAPNHIEALGQRARARFKMQRYQEAKLDQEKALKLNPYFSEAGYINYAQILLAVSQGKKAESMLDLVLTHRPGHSQALGILARHYLLQGQMEKAYQRIMEKKEGDPRDVRADILLVEYHFKKGELTKALAVSNALVNGKRPRRGQKQVSRAYAIGLTLRAKVFLEQNRGLEALRDLKTLESHGFTRDFAWMLKIKAEAYFKSGDPSAAQSILMQGIRKEEQIELSLLAALIRVERAGEGSYDKSENTSAAEAFIGAVLSSLSDQEVRAVMEASQSENWDYIPAAEFEDSTYTAATVFNSFWDSVYGSGTQAVDGQTRRSTFGRPRP